MHLALRLLKPHFQGTTFISIGSKGYVSFQGDLKTCLVPQDLHFEVDRELQ